MNTEPTVFSRIISRELPADIFFEDEDIIVIRTIEPKAPVHLLAITKRQFESMEELSTSDTPENRTLLWHLFAVASQVAQQQGLSKGYRLVTNIGEQAGQTVKHLHVHILGGSSLGEHTLAK